jgi:cellulose synthase (UDP-forming)
MPTVDVFVTACGEPTGLVVTTARAARDMLLPHRTWVLDDGDDADLESACVAEAIGYLRRDVHSHAKAGNVNAGLARTTGDYVVILDADHIPERDLLVEMLPHFIDPDVAFVQSPQHYGNQDNLVERGAAEAQRIFYELVCPGKNHFNAAFCVGTNVIFRRAALDDVGGIYTGSNSEDIWTSLELHRRGWRCWPPGSHRTTSRPTCASSSAGAAAGSRYCCAGGCGARRGSPSTSGCSTPSPGRTT